MIHRITILAISRKWGGRCVVGFDHNFQRLVRMVSNKAGKQLPKEICEGINPLDVVEVDVIRSCPLEHQTENILIPSGRCLRKTGFTSSIKDFGALVSNESVVFGNHQYKIMDASGLDHSIELIKFKRLSIRVERNENARDKAIADFWVGNTLHKWYRVTDIVHENEPATIEKGYAVITIPPTDEFAKGHGYYKYISAIYF